MIIYNDKNLSDFGVAVIGRGTFNAPARDIEKVHVPGRSGDMLFDDGSMQNIVVTYPDCCIVENFPRNVRALRNFLYTDPGYHKLEDSYNPETYRLGAFLGPFDAEGHTGRGNRSGVFSLSFDCKPYRYLRSGDNLIALPLRRTSGSNYIYTVSLGAVPFFTIYGSLSGATITITEYDSNGSSLCSNSYSVGNVTFYKYDIQNDTAKTAEISVATASSGLSSLSYGGNEFVFRNSGAFRTYATSIENKGTFESAPIWKITAGALAGLTIRGFSLASNEMVAQMTLTPLYADRTYYIDSETMEIWADGGGDAAPYNRFDGTAPRIPVGGLGLVVSGINEDTRIEVVPRWIEV